MTDKIYVIGHRSHDHWDAEVTIYSDYGFFSTREAAEAWLTQQYYSQHQYARYVEQRRETQAQYDESYRVATEKWKELEAAGIDPGKYLKPIEPVTVDILSYAEWSAPRRSAYALIEINENFGWSIDG